jgi:hypothetical protein
MKLPMCLGSCSQVRIQSLALFLGSLCSFNRYHGSFVSHIIMNGFFVKKKKKKKEKKMDDLRDNRIM